MDAKRRLSRPPAARVALWAALACGLAALAVSAVRMRLREQPAPPVLGRLAPFALTDQQGRPVSLASLGGEPWIASFVFTRCGGVCPRIVERLQTLAAQLPPGFRRVSVTVDPEYDTPEVLSAYAAARGIRDPRWLLLTGEPAAVRKLVLDGFMLAVGESTDPSEPILHSSRLVLVDGAGAIRGYYESEDAEAMAKLARDARFLARDRA
jgi:protein SCO1/2